MYPAPTEVNGRLPIDLIRIEAVTNTSFLGSAPTSLHPYSISAQMHFLWYLGHEMYFWRYMAEACSVLLHI